jgi:hypothetical protein
VGCRCAGCRCVGVAHPFRWALAPLLHVTDGRRRRVSPTPSKARARSAPVHYPALRLRAQGLSGGARPPRRRRLAGSRRPGDHGSGEQAPGPPEAVFFPPRLSGGKPPDEPCWPCWPCWPGRLTRGSYQFSRACSAPRESAGRREASDSPPPRLPTQPRRLACPACRSGLPPFRPAGVRHLRIKVPRWHVPEDAAPPGTLRAALSRPAAAARP